MAIQIGDEDKPYNEINVTPMIDVMLVLLIIFILLTTAAVQGIKVDLPSASSAKPLEAQKSRVIAVADDGTISIDAIPVSLSELERELRTSIASTPDLAVILRGDRAVAGGAAPSRLTARWRSVTSAAPPRPIAS
ncbi:ExbD/TolR family protein [Sphingomonas koreensis]|uniref:ExbD/TolR family protein n=1 Tax=Sphingomonas koreensis TaxID=93064 RepID=UPI000F7EDA47|nr:biopolymer transporter ExbD [Sphingomonas koreensis]RSY94159.1 biopolymer transporter ExbD [Sphingomonas koreensis]